MKTEQELAASFLQDADLSQLDCGVSERILKRIRDEPDYNGRYDDIARVLHAFDCKTVLIDVRTKAKLLFGESKRYRYAIVKFNSFAGALLCNGCKTIISEGFDHIDKLHYCEDCKNVSREG